MYRVRMESDWQQKRAYVNQRGLIPDWPVCNGETSVPNFDPFFCWGGLIPDWSEGKCNKFFPKRWYCRYISFAVKALYLIHICICSNGDDSVPDVDSFFGWRGLISDCSGGNGDASVPDVVLPGWFEKDNTLLVWRPWRRLCSQCLSWWCSVRSWYSEGKGQGKHHSLQYMATHFFTLFLQPKLRKKFESMFMHEILNYIGMFSRTTNSSCFAPASLQGQVHEFFFWPNHKIKYNYK